jgi:hypothetical protein
MTLLAGLVVRLREDAVDRLRLSIVDEKSSVTAFFVQRRSNGPNLAYWRPYLLLLGLESPSVG